ncbi:MAG: amidohydrolase family protein, partial [Clostridiales bacterium]|nr:amidohydrolase family protein [Clostridiales bacterium]
RLGSIEVGKDADLVIWNAHPFDLQATVAHTIVDGVVVYSAL